MRAMYSKDPSYRVRYLDASNALNKPYDGSWAKAQYRVKSMDTWERDSMKEYFGRMNF